MMLAVMAAVPWLLVLELCLYAACFVCGIVTAAALTISQGHLGGLCMLYGTVDYNVTSGAIGAQTSSSASVCYFVSAISVSVAIVCFSLSLYWLYTCCIDGEVHREHLWMNLTLGVCGVFLFFLLITGCMLKIGRDSLCESVTHTVPNITRCEEAQNRTWVSPLNGVQFYTSLHKAETAVWVNFFFWLIIGVLVFVQRGQLLMGGGGFKMAGGWGGWGFGGRGAADPTASPGETEPFFNRPARPQ